MAKEIWKPVNGFETYYEVSNMGRVRSKGCWRVSPHSRRWFKSKLLKTNGKYGGTLHLRGDHGQPEEIIQLHRLVALHFIPNPKGLPFVCHSDDDDGNNRASNLYWGNHQSNGKDAVSNGKLIPHWTGKKLSKKHRAAISKGLNRHYGATP